jgi:transposase
MQVLHDRCVGIDVGEKIITVCARLQQTDGKSMKTVRTFRTVTPELLKLQQWLLSLRITHVAMESTGVYWKPIFNILESSFEIVLANAHHVKTVPGRKTDIKDCEWIADLLAHGLIRASFIPPHPIRELRDLTRYRKTLIRSRVNEVNRIHKLLESSNIKLSSVVSDLLGKTGRAILEALVQGEERPEVLVELARGSLRGKRDHLVEALTGRFTDHHRFMLEQLLRHVDFIDAGIASCDHKIKELARPFELEIALLCTIPGISRRAAEVILSEIGVDMSRFLSAAHLASWARVCPGNNESAGKRYSGRTGMGNSWLRTTLIESSWSISRTKDTYLSALFRRVARRRGNKKAAVAVVHSLLVAVYHMLRDHEPYSDLGSAHFDRLNRRKLAQYHIRRLEELGIKIPAQVEELPAA